MIGPQNSTLRCLGFWPQFCNVFGTATIGSGRWCRGGKSKAELPQPQTIFRFAGCFNFYRR